MTQIDKMSIIINLVVPIITGMIGAVVGAVIKNRSDSKNEYRKSLIPRVQEIGEHLDGLLSKSTIFMHKCEALVRNPIDQKGEIPKASRRAVLDDIKSYKDKISEDRRSIRCLLWDKNDCIDEAMRRMEKVCGWITQFQSRPADGLMVLEKADLVRKRLDKIFAISCKKGEWPSWWQCKQLKKESNALKQFFEKDADDTIILGVDLPIPNELVLKFKKKAGLSPEATIKGNHAIRVYECILKALDKA